ncbi:prohead protease/major capsid protein fusion protein [Archangium lansingense]|uniref:Uncharacterized protein n=1 Tax=Archangium lansingense TaxID=2995310 RepID=A0ABT4ACC2_9BACT|nr:prohead protease/major capsid protein fusion protein [Archangium lansinium]MCY1078874.1 hypothetical protein [Archangium lansinium]
MTQTREMPPLSMRAAFEPSTLDRKNRTVEVTWTTGARVLRGWFDQWWEELEVSESAVDLSRLNSGAPFLANHDGYNVAATPGVVERAWLVKSGEQMVGRALVRFVSEGKDPEADKLFNKVAEGIVTNCSVGYRLNKLVKVEDAEDGHPVMRAVRWTPHEISAVAIGADAGAGFRSASSTDRNPCEFITRGASPQKESNVDENNAAKLERERITTINTLARKHSLGDEFARKLIDASTPLNEARALVLEELAKRSDNDGTSQAPSGAAERSFEVGNSYDGPDQRVRNMAAALAHRAGCREKLPEAANQYVRLSITDHARLCLEARGISPRLMSQSQIVKRALHSTSDFKALLTETGARVLLDGYQSYPAGLKQISRASSARDFRAKSLLRLGEAPELLPVNEHGEVKSGTMASSKQSYRLTTHARIFGISREAIINDDLGALDLIRLFGRAAAELEANQLVTLLTSNPIMGDSVSLFHVSRGNLSATNDALSVASLGMAWRALRTQKGLDGKTPANVVPRFAIVPAALEVAAMQLAATINATTTSDVNPWSGKIEPIVEPRLDAVSTTAWYVAADPASVAVLEHAYLDGQNGPEIMEEEGFEVMGTRWRCSLDFGCGVVDHVGIYKNNGA